MSIPIDALSKKHMQVTLVDGKSHITNQKTIKNLLILKYVRFVHFPIPYSINIIG